MPPSSESTMSSTTASSRSEGPLDLTSLRDVRSLLARHGLQADKRLGQHFLVDRSALRSIVEAAEVQWEDEVWEVGPGLGTLSVALAARAHDVRCIELDRRMLAVLQETLAPFPNVRVHHGDALGFDWREVSQGAKFVANLPYQVGTAIISALLESRRFARLVVLVQREVAERLVAPPGSPAFGSLSLWVAHHGRARIVRNVAPGAFAPPPKVVSAVVRIDPDLTAEPDPETFALIRNAFRHRRKTLLANLRAVGVPSSAVEGALATLAIDPRARAEILSLAQFRQLRRLLAPIS
jgi:16S rRNA (adenine1518-N6/adenine1519-N6)-dimethyltransferase